MTAKKTARYVEMARRASTNANYHHKLGAVIVKKNRVISVGFNKPHKTHSKANTKFGTIHAEFDAIYGCSAEDLKGATIYVIRHSFQGYGNAKPCSCCMELIKLVGIKEIIYSIDNRIETLQLY